ncbi:MAG: AlpA family phage regulatory protein [Thermoanaerobaculia bacterium]|nr:AlpA family phage regulatory protein [Thermoanaerobaculia bacterium]
MKRALGLSRSTVYAQIDAGLMPRPVSLGARAVGWPESSISAIVAARVRGASDAELRELVAALDRKRLGAV